MYCKFCGNEIDQGARYCDKCGSIVTENETPGMDDGYVPEVIDSYREAELDNSARKSLVFGILSIAFGSIIGIIFALIGGKHAKRYADLNAYITVSFSGAEEKRMFCDLLGISEDCKFIQGQKLLEIIE